MKDLRVVFMGTPEFSVPVLNALIDNTNVVLVVTKEDAYIGRKKVLTKSPIKIVAEEANIPVLTPQKLKQEYESILNYKPDIIITCAYGKIVPKEILDYPEYGCFNVHASLLPKYRGASPISAAIKDGEEETGITIIKMDEGLDTGNIVGSKDVKIEDNDTLGTMEEKLSKVGAELMLKVIPKILDDTYFNIKQDDEGATYVSILKRSDEILDFSMTRKEVYNHIRSLNPHPLASINIDNLEYKVAESQIGKSTSGNIGEITSVSKDSFGIMCSDGELLITKIKPSGKNIMTVKDYFNGYKKENLLGKKVKDIKDYEKE